MWCMADDQHVARTRHCQMVASRWTVAVGRCSIAPALAARQGPRAEGQDLPEHWKACCLQRHSQHIDEAVYCVSYDA